MVGWIATVIVVGGLVVVAIVRWLADRDDERVSDRWLDDHTRGSK